MNGNEGKHGWWRGRRGRPDLRVRHRTAVLRIGMAVSALLASVIGVAVTTPAAVAAPATLNIGVLNESTGEFGAQFGPLVPGVQAWASWVNSHGGLNGHKVSLKIYNNASSPSQVVANAHLAVQNGAVALIDSDPLFDSAAPYLQSVGIPVYAFGITPGFFGADKTNFFSYTGNPIDGKSTASVKFLVKKGKTKFALLSDPSPADSAGIKTSVPLIAKAGGKVVYTNFNVDPTNTASLLAVAQAVKNSGATVVDSAAGERRHSSKQTWPRWVLAISGCPTVPTTNRTCRSSTGRP